MVKGVGGAKVGGERNKHAMGPVVGHGGADVEGAFALSRPRRTLFRGVVVDAVVSGGVDGVGGNVVGGTVQAVPSGDRGI